MNQSTACINPPLVRLQSKSRPFSSFDSPLRTLQRCFIGRIGTISISCHTKFPVQIAEKVGLVRTEQVITGTTANLAFLLWRL